MYIKEAKTENDVETYLVKECKQSDILCYKFVSPSNVGVPDRILIYKGNTYYVETKSPGEKPRLSQQIVHKRFKEHGVIVHVIDSKSGVDDIIKTIKMKRGKKHE